MATRKLSKALGTEVSIKKVNFSIFNRLNLEGTLIRDKQKDTLLYAGQLKLRITDWFFLKDTIELKYIGLEDAVIKMNRKDSVWNYAYIADYFSSSDTTKKSSGINLNLKKLDFKNLRFIKNDQWVGEKMTIKTVSLLVDADKINLKNKQFSINSIELDRPFVGIQGLKALRPDSLIHRSPTVDTGMYFNTGNISVSVKNITIHNGSLFLDSDSDKPLQHFDGSHIQLSQLSGTLQTVSFLKDTIRANLDLTVKDRCGLELKKLKAHFRLTPEILELDKLDLQTNKSRLTNYYAMKFKDFNKDFGHYNSKVTMQARFDNAKVSSDDIAYFAPELKSWKKEVVLSGNFLGTVENLSVPNLSAKIGATTRIFGNLKMKGLPDINTTQIQLTNGSLQTNYYDLGTFIPALKGVTSPNLPALGTILYRGGFSGTIQNFVTAGTFSTQLGGVKTNVSLTLPQKGDPVYTGGIETTRFNLGKFLNDSLLGLVDFKGKITGTSFNIDRLKTTVEGTVSALEYNKYNYTNIITLGTFQKKSFSGEIKIDDPNLDFTSTVEIDLSKDLPSFNIVGDLVKCNLKPLNILQNPPIELTGLLDVNFTGTTIDNFLGKAKFLNGNITNGETRLNFDSLNLSSSYENNIKTLHLGSNEIDATIQGNFNIKDLPTSFQGFLTRYYPTYIKQPKSVPDNQAFTFKVRSGYIEPYLQLFDKKITGFNDANISGNLDTRKNQLQVNAAIPLGGYDHYSISGLNLTGEGKMDTLSLKGSITNVQVSDSLHFPNSVLNITSSKDHSIVSIKTSADNTLNDADLHAEVYTLNDGARIIFKPSSFVLNDKKWTIEDEGELLFRTNLVQAKKVRFTQGYQEIAITSPPPVNGSKANNLKVSLQNVVLGDLSSIFFKKPRLEGLTTGTINLNDLTGHFTAKAELNAEQFRLDTDSIGLVNIHATYDNKTGDLPFAVESPNEGYNFKAQGNYNIKDTTGNSFTTNIQLEQSKIDILHMFLSDLFTDISGKATGDLKISGNLNAPDLFGKIHLQNAGMKVNYSQVYYTIDSADIDFNKEGIDFGSFKIHDRYHNNGTVSGQLKEKGFKNLFFNFLLKTDKLLLIDTKATDNQQFYGKAIGSASLTLNGPENNAKMSIKATSNDSSQIYIPNSISKESGVADFIVFKEYGTEMAQEKNKSNFNLTVDLELTATNDVTIDVILDELTGDVIKAKGNGTLKIRAGTTEPLSIRGKYNIEGGSYLFNFQGFIRKPFELMSDAGNYINWSGDPYAADIHIDAQYTAERVSLSDLVSNLQLSSAVQGYRGDVYVIARLTDKLTKPDIKFRIDFPQGSPVKSDNEFTQYLNRLERDQNEILNQVAFLILFNSFAPPGNGGGNTNGVSPYSVTSIGINTLSQILTKSVNKVLSNLLFKLTGDKGLRFDLGTSVYSSSNILNSSVSSSSNNKLDRTRIDLKLGYAFANDKIIVTLGSDIDINLGNSVISNSNTQWLPNVNIEFVLSKDKKLRLIVFNKTSLDLNGINFGRRNRQGVSISYRKDFETFFGKKEKETELPKPAKADGEKSPQK